MASASTVCRSCGAELGPGVKFCSQCGAPAGRSDRPPPAEREERKVVTALFADIVGSTALAERLDPEDFRAVVDGAIRHMIDSVEAFGGSFSEFAGDGVLALFGVPVAHEDDAERSVLAGLRIAERIARYAAEVAGRWRVDRFGVRVGIETGLAVIARIETGRGRIYGATGDALNTAARLQSAASPGAVVVGPRTHEAVLPLFDWNPPIELTLKGKASPVAAHVVEAVRLGERAPRGVPGTETLLVGREGELEAIKEAVDEVHAGRGGLLLVLGEAGIGKSRLLQEARALFERPGERPALWLQGRCVSYAEALPYWPFQDLLTDWLGGSRPGSDLGAALDERLGDLFATEAGELKPFLASMLGVAVEGDDAERLAALSAESLQYGTVSAVRRLLQRISTARPLAIAVDDLHWADASSLALIEQLLSVTEDTAVLLVLAARIEREHPSWRVKELAERSLAHRTRQLALNALTSEDERELLAELVGRDTLPPPLERELLERSDGNPFYLEELVRSMVDAGALVRDAARWRYKPDVPLVLPETLERVVLARIDRLEPGHREVLDAASVIGRHFDLPVLSAVVGDPDAVTAALRELQRVDLVHEGVRWPEPEFRFKHSLIQEAAYKSLLRGRRQDVHRRAAEALERLLGERADERYGLIAHHFHAAGELTRAFDYHRRAGQSAARIYAAGEAAEHYTAALECATALGMREEEEPVYRLLLDRGGARLGSLLTAREDFRAALRGARAAGDRRAEMEALLQLGVTARAADYAEAENCLDGALRIAQEVGDRSAQVRVLSRLSITDSNGLRFERALELSRDALNLVSEGPEAESTRAIPMDSLKLAALQIGDLETLEETTSTLAAIHRSRGDLWYLQFALLESAFVPIASGNAVDALARLRESLAISEEHGDFFARSLGLDALAWLHRSRGEYGAALAAGDEAMRTAIEHDIPELKAWTAATHAWALLELHAPERAAPLLQEGLEAARQSGARNQLVRCLCLMTWAAALLGERTADGLVAQAREMIEQVTAPRGRAWLFGAHAYVALARTLEKMDGAHEAEELLLPVVAAAEDSGWMETVINGSAVIGTSRLRRGDLEGARSALCKAIDFARGGEFPGATLEAHIGLAELYAARGEKAKSMQHATGARELSDRASHTIGEAALSQSFAQAVAARLGP